MVDQVAIPAYLNGSSRTSRVDQCLLASRHSFKITLAAPASRIARLHPVGTPRRSTANNCITMQRPHQVLLLRFREF